MTSTPQSRRDVLKGAAAIAAAASVCAVSSRRAEAQGGATQSRARIDSVLQTQILPFADPRTLKLYGQFESGVYDALKA